MFPAFAFWLDGTPVPYIEADSLPPLSLRLVSPVLSLLLCGANSQEKMWRPCCKDTPGSPVLFPRWAFPELMNLPEGKGGGVVMKKHPEKVSYMEIENPLELVDADTPETLEMLKGKAL